MIETLFSPPHNASDDEYILMWPSASTTSRHDWIREEESRKHDVRWTAIFDLYDLRRDKGGMAHALAQIQDRAWAAEMTYRDVFTTEEFERMARDSKA